MNITFVRSSLLLLCATFAIAVRADDFTARCAELSRQVNVSVTFQDRPDASDDTHNVQELNRIAGRPPGDYHSVYGLTHARPDIRMRVATRALTGDDGRVCAIPDIALELGFSAFVVYLAKELTDPCHREIVRQHEQEHVNTWKSHLRASAQLLTTVLRRNIGEAHLYASRDEAEQGVRARAAALVAPWPKRILDSVGAAQDAIDTPVSYGIVTSRLRTCGQSVRGGSR